MSRNEAPSGCIGCIKGGAATLEGNYPVYLGNQAVGKVQVTRQGLYYSFCCRCQLTGAVVCRLHVSCGDHRENLGVVVPLESGFGLDTRLPTKRLGAGSMDFTLIPRHEETVGFYPICPEEPFSYLSRLKDAYLAKKDGQLGIMIKG